MKKITAFIVIIRLSFLIASLAYLPIILIIAVISIFVWTFNTNIYFMDSNIVELILRPLKMLENIIENAKIK